MPSFTADRVLIEDDVSEWDLLQWAIEDTICENPLASSHLIGADSDLRYFKTWEHPGTSHLPRLVIVFRIDRPPSADGTPGLIEGHRLVKLADLNGGFTAGGVLPWVTES